MHIQMYVHIILSLHTLYIYIYTVDCVGLSDYLKLHSEKAISAHCSCVTGT